MFVAPSALTAGAQGQEGTWALAQSEQPSQGIPAELFYRMSSFVLSPKESWVWVLDPLIFPT